MNTEYPDNFSCSPNYEYNIAGLDYTILNGDISPEELKGAKGLKVGKSCGINNMSRHARKSTIGLKVGKSCGIKKYEPSRKKINNLSF